MNIYDFRTWQQQRDRERREHVPAADRIVPMVAQAGPGGMSRGQIGGAIDLERDDLDRLLAGLVEFGLLTHSQGVFRAR